MQDTSSTSDFDDAHTLHTDSSDINAHIASRISFTVEAINGESVSAVIWPNVVSPDKVAGSVEWLGDQNFLYFFTSEGDPCPWYQQFIMLYLGAGPKAVPYVPVLAAEKWQAATLTLPDIDAAVGEKVHLTLHKATWLATLLRTRDSGISRQLRIPQALQQADVGELFAEMTSRLLLGKPWLD